MQANTVDIKASCVIVATETRSGGKYMKLVSEPFNRSFNHAVAAISARGEPHRRTWQISAHWDLRDGKVSGHLGMDNAWLNAILGQLLTIEREVLIKAYGVGRPLVEFQLYCEPDLRRSVLGTATRFNIELNY